MNLGMEILKEVGDIHKAVKIYDAMVDVYPSVLEDEEDMLCYNSIFDMADAIITKYYLDTVDCERNLVDAVNLFFPPCLISTALSREL